MLIMFVSVQRPIAALSGFLPSRQSPGRSPAREPRPQIRCLAAPGTLVSLRSLAHRGLKGVRAAVCVGRDTLLGCLLMDTFPITLRLGRSEGMAANRRTLWNSYTQKDPRVLAPILHLSRPAQRLENDHQDNWHFCRQDVFGHRLLSSPRFRHASGNLLYLLSSNHLLHLFRRLEFLLCRLSIRSSVLVSAHP